MYHSYQPYTGNTGLSNCILGMGNLTACAHVSVKYGTFWKIISTRRLNLKFIFVGQNILELCKMSKFHVVHDEPGANSTCLHAR